MLRFDVISIFPSIFKGFVEESLLARGQKKKLIKINLHNLRRWTKDKHKTVDDRPFGGGPGMGALLARLEAHFDACWCARYQSPYVWAHFKDKPQMKRLLKTLTVEEIEARMVSFLCSEEPFVLRARHSFAVFVASINALPGLHVPVPIGCAHTPPCGSEQTHTARRQQELRHGAA